MQCEWAVQVYARLKRNGRTLTELAQEMRVSRSRLYVVLNSPQPTARARRQVQIALDEICEI